MKGKWIEGGLRTKAAFFRNLVTTIYPAGLCITFVFLLADLNAIWPCLLHALMLIIFMYQSCNYPPSLAVLNMVLRPDAARTKFSADVRVHNRMAR